MVRLRKFGILGVAVVLIGLVAGLGFYRSQRNGSERSESVPAREPGQPLVRADALSPPDIDSGTASGEINASTENERIATGTVLGAMIYSGDPGYVLRNTKKMLALIPRHLHRMFWANFWEAAAQTSSTKDHVVKAAAIAPPLRDFLKDTICDSGFSAYEQLLGRMAVEGYNRDANQFASEVSALPERSPEEAAYKFDWEKITFRAKLRKDPIAGLEILPTLGPDMQKELAGPLVQFLGAEHPDKALSFFLSADYPGPVGQTIMTGMLQSYSRSDPAAVSEQIRDAAPSPQKDAAAAYLAARIASSEPDAARAWASSIADAELRDRALRDVEERIAAGGTRLDRVFDVAPPK